ncbi:serine/threonine protein kinase [Bifidobacterium lemurum]|uniref:non-specific serine/threonine protein kinase n=1 Tax=Bifidobacterium lemurum TaxID=1603886 RepID=A0A261FW64_9BIFI|nr:Stk1 family PASTA domain-containing Ser/Thr kinase [Bifidobacterium lemurum]OZG63392.1 serine/threonine protein kinase [Bifidobacterium lemurum]QOL34298.1 PASTA domain-containing protein [Bifidobacterium lemurum]
MTEAFEEPNGRTMPTIDGRYRVVRKIAEGGMATVFEAVDERLDRTVAVKVMHTQLAQGPHRDQFVERFRREAKSAAAIANPHIVQVYDTGEFNGLDYLVMEYVHGVNLRHEMNQQRTFSVRETLRVVSETLDGLASAHRAGVVHRDIKPENILLNSRGHVQITDFGLAKAASQATLSSTGMLLGTAAYLAPEMIENNQATPQGDLYSVGIMAWEMLSGDVPFHSDNPVTLVFKHVHEDVPSVATVCPGIAPAVAEFLAHLTARQVDRRPASAVEAADELRALTASLGLEDWQYRKTPDHGSPDSADKADDTTFTPIVSGSSLPPAPPAGATAQPTTAIDSAATRVVPLVQSDDAASALMRGDGSFGEQTQVLGGLGDAFTQTIMTEGGTSSDETEDLPKKKRSRKPLIIGLAVVLALAMLGSGGAWWYFLGPGSYWSVPQPTDVACEQDATDCSLTGAVWSDYESTLKVAGIPYETVEDYSDDIAEGSVITATVGGSTAYVGSHVSKRDNATLTVTVSQGVRTATIPEDILDPTSESGKAPLDALQAAGFTNITHDESQDVYSENLPEGTAVSVSPDPGTTLNHNDEVSVVLSKGPMPVSMPDILGRSQDEATTALSDLKLNANFTEEYSDTVEAGDVISASVDAGTQLHWGDTVDVVVSKGPEMVTIPDVRGQSTTEATQTLEALGLQVKVSAPLGDLTHTVRLQNPSPGEQVRLRDTDGNATVVTLTVV